MLGNIDLSRAFNYIWKSPFRNQILIKWGIIGILYMATSFIVQFALQIIGAVAGDESTIFAILAVLIVLFVYIIMITVSLFAYGATVNNYLKISKALKNGETDLVAQDSNLDMKSSLLLGLKSCLVILYYSLPLIILAVVVAVPLILLGESMPAGESLFDSGAGTLFCGALIIFYIVIILYSLFLNYAVYPAILKIAEESGFKAAFNASRVIQVAKANYKNYLWLILGNLVVGLVALIVWMLSAVSILLCIGIILLPMSYGWMFMIQAYVNAHMMAQVNSQIKSAN